ncbi:MAG: hypothetical protein HZB68_03155, partial [Candidatus Aenigmarchaeota archaeon]|nr:hypothetical protein [Candidatus Aenigmarchaeota archaeon]
LLRITAAEYTNATETPMSFYDFETIEAYVENSSFDRRDISAAQKILIERGEKLGAEVIVNTNIDIMTPTGHFDFVYATGTAMIKRKK